MTVRSLIVTPTYNERDNLEVLVSSVFDALPQAHILVVDDASPDGTGALADDMATRDARVHVLHRPRKQGLGTAYLAGFAWGLEQQYEYLFEMDADLSHDPKYLPNFLEALDRGADLVIGSRNVPGGDVEGWGPVRRFISKGGSLYSRSILGLEVRDLTSGFKGFRRKVLETIALDQVESEGYSFQIELTYRAVLKGFSVVEIPIVFVDRRAGQSKMSGSIFVEAIWMVPRLRWNAGRGRLVR
ncbi:MAG: polyprenol monophosphomannose synthase [Myxococcales bacterium]|nr:polyprenol monophosphomannose synthase [Myxococcales bacterium]MDH3486086.1 polyprenol monophosphomannose synthase [Myxococcales bacterium]